MRHLPAGHCGGCGDPFEKCGCDAMGIPAPKASSPLVELCSKLLGRPLRVEELAAVKMYEMSLHRA